MFNSVPIPTGNDDCLLIKYNSSGIVQWVSRIDGDRGHSIATDDTGLYISLQSHSNLNVYDIQGNLYYSSNQAVPITRYIIKYNFDGSIVWINRLEANNSMLWWAGNILNGEWQYVGVNGLTTDNLGYLYNVSYSDTKNPGIYN